MKNAAQKRKIVGEVVSDKMNKTVVVAVTRLKAHPLYQKRFCVRTKFKAHDEKNECRIGDRVVIEETRPLSKEKRWRVAKKLEK